MSKSHLQFVAYAETRPSNALVAHWETRTAYVTDWLLQIEREKVNVPRDLVILVNITGAHEAPFAYVVHARVSPFVSPRI